MAYQTTVCVTRSDGTKYWKHIRARSKTELNRKKMQVLQDVNNGYDVAARQTFQYWADKWYREVKEPSGISLGTLKQYESALSVLNKALGDEKIGDITLSDFQCFINEYSQENPHTGKRTSRRMLVFYQTVAKDICIYAKDNHQKVSNFYKAVIPKNAPKQKRRALTPTEIQWVVETEHPMQLGAMIMLFAGLRLNELCALRWSDIDLGGGWIHVQNFVDFYHRNDKGAIQRRDAHIKSTGKSESATRYVAIPPVLVSFLRQYIAEHGKESMYVFVRLNGQLHTYNTARYLWDKYFDHLNRTYGFTAPVADTEDVPTVIDKFTPHYLRHTYATLLYWQGIQPTDAMEYLGHSDIQMTMNVYTDAKGYCRARLPEDIKQKLMTVYKVTGNDSQACVSSGGKIF